MSIQYSKLVLECKYDTQVPNTTYSPSYYKRKLTAEIRQFVVSKWTVLDSVTYPVFVNTSSVSASILMTLTRYVSKYNKLLLQFV